LKEKLKEQVFGKDTSKPAAPADTSKSKTGVVIKDKLKNIFTKPKKPVVDTTKK
jgi:hypothetical protein